MTLIEIIKQLFEHIPTSNIIIGTPSNSAANLITENLIKSKMFDKPHDFIRLVSVNQVEKDQIPDTLLKYCGIINTQADDGTMGLRVIFV